MPTLLNPATVGLPVTPTANAADATGNYIIPGQINGNQDVIVRVNNGSGVSVTVTLDDPNTTVPEGSSVTGSTYPDIVTSVAAGAARYYVFTKARRDRFTDPLTGRINFSITPVTTVTLEVVSDN